MEEQKRRYEEEQRIKRLEKQLTAWKHKRFRPQLSKSMGRSTLKANWVNG
jgi:hypothetical protein